MLAAEVVRSKIWNKFEDLIGFVDILSVSYKKKTTITDDSKITLIIR